MPENRFERYFISANRAVVFIMMAVMTTLVPFSDSLKISSKAAKIVSVRT